MTLRKWEFYLSVVVVCVNRSGQSKDKISISKVTKNFSLILKSMKIATTVSG